MGEIDFKSVLLAFSKESNLYYATETLLRDGFGIYILSNNPNHAENNYFRNNEANYQYVKKALERIETIMPMGRISRETLSDGLSHRYDTIKIFACEAKEGIAREDIAALTRAFNRIDSTYDEIYRTRNRPVLVFVRQGKELSIATCQRIPKMDNQDQIGNVIILQSIDCENPRLGHLQILNGMVEEIKECSSFDELYKKLLRSLSIDIVSDNFFNGYTRLFKEIVKEASDNKKIKKEFLGFPDPDRAIRNYVKKLMGRIVFIQFLQRKGWMGVPSVDEGWATGNPEFIQDLFENTDRKDTFVDDILLPLFHDLNIKRDGDLANNCLGKEIKIPYLNGGLFDKDEYDRVQFPLPAETTRRMLEFFRSYNFTIDENDQDTVEVGVDPEMLSRIFESLLEDNKATGAFYTPKEIVGYMCRESLITYLQSGLEDKSKKMAYRDFVMNHDVSVLQEEDLTLVDRKLCSVKICDPAIGSGAFPMGMLKELFECRKAIEQEKNSGVFNASDIKKDILQHSIYGVDIDKGAVDIARLRFWLALIIEEKTPHALPNMDFKIMQGNSLLERYEGIDLSEIETHEQKRRKGGRKKEQFEQQSLVFDEGDALKNIQSAILKYYKTDRHDEKAELREIINNNVREYIRHLKGSTSDIRRKLASLPIPNDQFFLWHIYFKEIFDEGGFDIVIGNPPYIELQKMKGMSEVYEKCGFETYTKSADIYCLFTEHGFNLLKKGGTLCYIMMNKWMQAEYGRPLRRFILNRKIHQIVDFGDVQVFKNATTYPCIILLGNDNPESSFRACRLRSDDLNTVADLSDEFPTSDFDDDLWVLSSRKSQELFKKLDVKYPSLMDYLGFPAKYGIKPGLSGAFQISEDTRCRLVGESASADEVIVPFLTGKDISPYERPNIRNYLILFKKGDTLKLMGKDGATEDEAWKFLQSRYPSICGRLSHFEDKAKKRSDKGDFWWELRACNYYWKFGMPKIMYQTFQVKPNFIYDTEGCFCNNSMWIIPTENKALLGLLNSKIGWWLVSCYCSLIQNGHQLIWDYFGRIPIALKKEGDEAIAKYVDLILAAKESEASSDTTCLEHEIDCRLYELYGLTNGEVKTIDPEAQTFGADFELYKRKPSFQMTPEMEVDRIYSELKERFDKLAIALDNEEAEIRGHYDLSSTTKPSKEELEDAFNKWNCAILTAFRGSETLSKEDNLKRNIMRNEELKASMNEQGLLYRTVDGYYIEIVEGENEKRKVPVNEFSFFVTNTDANGATRMDDDRMRLFFKRIYRLAEHFEQDSFLFTFPGANRVAFLVATNNGGRSEFRNDARFAGPLFTDVQDLDAWTGCSDDGRIAFMLKGMVQKRVPGYRGRVWIGEGDIFDIDDFRPDCLVIVHDGKQSELKENCRNYQNVQTPLFEHIIDGEIDSDDGIRSIVSSMLESISSDMRTISFHCSVCLDGSYAAGAKAAYESVLAWADKNQNRLTKIVIVDMFGDYFKID